MVFPLGVAWSFGLQQLCLTACLAPFFFFISWRQFAVEIAFMTEDGQINKYKYFKFSIAREIRTPSTEIPTSKQPAEEIESSLPWQRAKKDGEEII